MSSLFLELSKQQKLLQMMKERGFTLSQQNGQRTYGGPPPNWGNRPSPSRDSEVFIGRIPRMCFEDELIPLFLSVGELYEFRLMLDFSGTNRGYGYAHYATFESAMNAIKLLNRYEIRPGHHIGVLKSKNNCRLLFGNIRPDRSYNTFNDFIRKVTGHVLNVFTFSNFEQLRLSNSSISLEVEEAFLERLPRHNPNCQFAIVEYENHRAAAVARRILIPKYGHIFAIDWAVPPREKKRNIQVDSLCSTVFRTISLDAGNSRTSLAPMNYFSKSRPVPTLVTPPSMFDSIPFMPIAFSNVVKYFKFLISETLKKSVQSAAIPLSVFAEIDRKIVRNITNLENCGQGIQLIFNYLSWYNEMKTYTMDSESHQVLQEVKVYADSMVHFMFHRISSRKSVNSTQEEYYCSILPLQLNVLFHVTFMLPDEEREKLCGRISANLKWLVEVIQNGKSGDMKIKELLMETLRVEMELDGLSVNEELLSVRPILFRNTPTQIGAYLDKSKSAMGLTNDDNQSVALPVKNFSKAGSFSGSFCKTLFDDAAVEIDPIVQRMNPLKSTNPAKKPNWDHGNAVPHSLFNDSDDQGSTVNRKCDAKHAVLGFALHTFLSPEENWPQSESDKNGFTVKNPSSKMQNVPVLIHQSSLTNYVHYMPKTFYNVAKYFKYIIRCCLETATLNAEIPFDVYKEFEVKLIQQIDDLEGCKAAAEFISDYFSGCRLINNDLLKALQDVKIYSNSFLNYIRNRDSYGGATNRDLEDYYCRVLPYQLSFLYHMVMVLTGEEKIKLSGRVSGALQWLNELIHKNKSGDIEAVEFFEQISKIALEKGNRYTDENYIKSVVGEAFNEYNVIINPPENLNLY